MIPPIGVQPGVIPRGYGGKLDPKSDFIFGFDIGQKVDPSALVVVERTLILNLEEAGKDHFHYTIRFINRWPLNTFYPKVVDDVCDYCQRDPMNYPLLAVDYTGVGTALVDFLRVARPAARIHPILITSGHAAKWDNGSWHVPKKELVSVMVKLIQAEHLTYAGDLGREGQELETELNNFKVKITTAGNESFEAWRENKDKDDIVLAASCAVWLGERGVRQQFPSAQPVMEPRPHTPKQREQQMGSHGRKRGLFGLDQGPQDDIQRGPRRRR